jgi:hypothetical protein
MEIPQENSLNVVPDGLRRVPKSNKTKEKITNQPLTLV